MKDPLVEQQVRDDPAEQPVEGSTDLQPHPGTAPGAGHPVEEPSRAARGSARGQWIAVGIIVALLASALTVGVLLSDDLIRVEVGGEAPPFSAVDMTTGEEVTLADYRGEVVLLNIWATWCAPCRTEMPSIQRLHDTLASEGLKVLAVSVDAGNPRAIREFTEELNLSFRIAHDETQRIEIDYQTTGLPETFIIDRQGRIAHWRIGEEVWDSPANIARLRRMLSTED